MKGHSMSQNLRPITNAFRGGRLVIMLLFALFITVMVLGFVAQTLRPTFAPAVAGDSSTGRVR